MKVEGGTDGEGGRVTLREGEEKDKERGSVA